MDELVRCRALRLSYEPLSLGASREGGQGAHTIFGEAN